MIRIVVQTSDASMAVHVNGPLETSIKTFDIDAPELEKFMSEFVKHSLSTRTIIGVELL